jgi:hypothetical protein
MSLFMSDKPNPIRPERQGKSSVGLNQSIPCTDPLHVAWFSHIVLIDARLFSCGCEEFSSDCCMPDTTPIFHKRLGRCKNRGVKQRFSVNLPYL